MSTTVKPTTAERIDPAARRWPAVLTLASLAPLIAELGVGSIPASKAWTLPFFGYVSLIWMDPRRIDSAIHLVVVGALAAALVGWGLLRHPAMPRDRPIPEPRSLVVLSAISVAGYFALLMQLPGAEHSAYLPDRLAWLAPVLALALLASGTAVCSRWSTSTRWSPVHSAALVAGALPAHSVLGLVVLPLGTLDQVALAAIIAAEVVVGVWLIRRTRNSELMA